MTVEVTANPSEARPEYEQLRWLTDQYMAVQKLRIGNSNRVFAATEGLDTNEPDPFLAEMVDDLEALEKKIFLRMKRVVKHHPAWEWLEQVKGMGPTLSTKVLGLIADIEKFPSVSHLWSFSGYGLKAKGRPYDPEESYQEADVISAPNGHAYLVVRVHSQSEKLLPLAEWSMRHSAEFGVGRYTLREMGPASERQRPVKGEKMSYNRRLKTAIYLVGDSFIKSRSPYRDVYDEAKIKYRYEKQILPMVRIMGDQMGGLVPDDVHAPSWLLVLRETPAGKAEWDKLIKEGNKAAGANHDGAVWSDGHVDNAARRKMVKLFLSHLWLVWRKAEGLPIREPYAHEYLGHTSLSDPWSFSS
jgi:hypothetical protein